MQSIDTNKLCEQLETLAATVQNPAVQQKIYQTARQLKLLDELARESDNDIGKVSK